MKTRIPDVVVHIKRHQSFDKRGRVTYEKYMAYLPDADYIEMGIPIPDNGTYYPHHDRIVGWGASKWLAASDLAIKLEEREGSHENAN